MDNNPFGNPMWLDDLYPHHGIVASGLASGMVTPNGVIAHGMIWGSIASGQLTTYPVSSGGSTPCGYTPSVGSPSPMSTGFPNVLGSNVMGPPAPEPDVAEKEQPPAERKIKWREFL